MAGQPSNIEPYIQPGNPVTRNPLEEKATRQLHHHDGKLDSVSTATSSGHNTKPQDAIPSALGRGVRGGSGPVDAQEAQQTKGMGHRSGRVENQNESVDAEQMAPLAEGKVADAVREKSGTQKAPGSGSATAPDFASNLDKKKMEQASAREEIKEARKIGARSDGETGGRVGGDESLLDV